jgi:hypothetical protein
MIVLGHRANTKAWWKYESRTPRLYRLRHWCEGDRFAGGNRSHVSSRAVNSRGSNMRRWNVDGADSRTGQEVEMNIEAITAEEAERIAGGRGILVSGVQEAASPDDTLAAVAAAANMRRTQIPPPVAYASALARQTAPNYMGLSIGGSILGVFAGIYYCIGLFMLVPAIASIVNSATTPSSYVSGFSAMGGIGGVLISLMFLMIGGLLHALSAACVALRDIARNSFNR